MTKLWYWLCPVDIYGAQTNAPGATPFAPWITHKQELKPLKAQPQVLAQQLSQIQRRVEELEKRRM